MGAGFDREVIKNAERRRALQFFDITPQLVSTTSVFCRRRLEPADLDPEPCIAKALKSSLELATSTFLRAYFTRSVTKILNSKCRFFVTLLVKSWARSPIPVSCCSTGKSYQAMRQLSKRYEPGDTCVWWCSTRPLADSAVKDLNRYLATTNLAVRFVLYSEHDKTTINLNETPFVVILPQSARRLRKPCSRLADRQQKPTFVFVDEVELQWGDLYSATNADTPILNIACFLYREYGRYALQWLPRPSKRPRNRPEPEFQ